MLEPVSVCVGRANTVTSTILSSVSVSMTFTPAEIFVVSVT